MECIALPLQTSSSTKAEEDVRKFVQTLRKCWNWFVRNCIPVHVSASFPHENLQGIHYQRNQVPYRARVRRAEGAQKGAEWEPQRGRDRDDKEAWRVAENGELEENIEEARRASLKKKFEEILAWHRVIVNSHKKTKKCFWIGQKSDFRISSFRFPKLSWKWSNWLCQTNYIYLLLSA